MTIERAWVEEEGQGELIVEQAAARDELIRRGVPTETFHLKRLQQRKVPLGRGGSLAPTFVKPRDEQKLFTGFVVADRSALTRLEALGLSTPIWRSEVVGWRCERRYFVLDGEPIADRPYAGNDRERPDIGVVREALAAWRTAGGMPRACAADFGVLDDGRTALVEVNDAFGLGAYGLDASTYLDLLVARWSELTMRG